jgi:oligopeptide transport system ATP-binding protein
VLSLRKGSELSLLEVRNLRKFFPVRRGIFLKGKDFVKAVNGVSFSIEKGETLGLVGESGSGKSTTGLLLLRILEPTEGEVFFQERSLFGLSKEELHHMRPKMQIVFQDPQSSLNPVLRVSSIVGRPYKIHHQTGKKDVKELVDQMLEKVGLFREHGSRYPHEFSGGQRQRIAIARALILNPEFVILDEPTSALDVSVQAQILNLLKELQKELNLTYLFISHNLSVIRHMSNRVAVMYLGRIVELAKTEDLFSSPGHPYTQTLLSSILKPDPRDRKVFQPLSGEIPSLRNPPPGCTFHPRCTQPIKKLCRKEVPNLKDIKDGHWIACHLQV